MWCKHKKAQSTLEYILILTAIVGVIIWAAVNIIQPKMETTYGHIASSIEATGDQVNITTP